MLREMFADSSLNRLRCKKKWRKKNRHNFTTMGKKIFDVNSVYVGNGTYGELNVIQFEHSNGRLNIGHFCSIAPEVSFLLDGEHRYDLLSTYPFKARYLGTTGDTLSKGNITIDDDVWIGYRSIILSGTHIGRGAIVAAGAVVVSDIPPYSIVGGVPARVIKYRFDEDIVRELMKFDYSNLSEQIIKERIEELYKPKVD